MTDIEIAQAARPLPITEVAAKAGIDERFVECYGRTKGSGILFPAVDWLLLAFHQ